MKRDHVPIRTCRACGRKASKQEFDRLVVQQGNLVPEERFGRGIYSCRETGCLEKLFGILKKKRKSHFLR